METRYLLIIAKDLSLKRIIIESCRNIGMEPEIIFGSGFSGDMNFSKVIFRILMTVTLHIMYKTRAGSSICTSRELQLGPRVPVLVG